MKILYGVQKPDDGTIEVDGARRRLSSPADAIKLGIGMVFQHFMLADNLTVLENVVLGAEKLHGIGDKARAEVEEISERLRLRPRPRRARRGPRRRRAAARGDPQGALPRRQGDHPRRADRGAGPAGGRRALRRTSASSRPRATPCSSSPTSSTRCSRSPTTSPSCAAAPPWPPSPGRRHRAQARRADGRLRAALAEHRGVHGHRRGDARAARRHARRRGRAPAARRRLADHPPRRGARHRRRRGQRPDRAHRGRDGHAAPHLRPRRARRRRRLRLVDQAAPRAGRLHPRGPAATRPAARLAAVGEPHPRPPDPRRPR